jgi:RND family efflux transporter MFP subunit
MSEKMTWWRQVPDLIGRIALLLVFSAGVVLLLLWLAGKFEKKVASDIDDRPAKTEIAGRIERVQPITLAMTETAVGSIRAVHETSIGSKLLARVVEVDILKAGQKVKAGEVLFRLDDTDLKAKLQQAKSALESANAVAAQAEADAGRARQLLPSHAVSQQDYEKALSAERTAKADIERSAEALKEVQAALDWATVRSPRDGDIIDKKVDVGDMVVPGQILATLYDPSQMQLVASVRDSLAGMLEVDQEIGVQVQGIDKRCSGRISEIVPESEAASRSFLVKVTGPCPPGIHSGRFGRMYIPIRQERVLAIPAAAVRNVGQLELVDVVEKGKPVVRSIRTGRTAKSDPALGDRVEVLSGLAEGEEIVVPDAKS